MLLFVVFMAQLLLWQSKNNNYFNYDSFRHYFKSVQIFDELSQFEEGAFSRIKNMLGRYPPGVYLTTAFFYLFLPPTQDNVVVINTGFYMAVLFFSLYKLGTLLKDERTGLLSCVLVALYPAVFNQAKIYMLDLPLLSVVTLSVYLLIKSDCFQSIKYSCFFIFSLLAGLYIKLNFLFFIVGPLGYVFFVRMKRGRIKTQFFLFIALVFIGCIISYVLFMPSALFREVSYSRDLGGVIHNVGMSNNLMHALFLDRIFRDFYKLRGSGVIMTSTSVYLRDIPFILHKIRGLLWYVWGFVNWQAGFFAFIAFAGGLYAFVKSKNIHRPIVLAWLLPSYFILSWFIYAIDFDMEVTGIRYSMPLLGCIALISAYGLLAIKQRIARISCICILLSLSFMQVAFSSFPLSKNYFSLKMNIPQDRLHFLPASLVFFSTEPIIISGSNWTSLYGDRSTLRREIEGVFSFINGFYENKQLKILLLSDNSEWWHLEYLAYKHNKDLIFFCDYSRLRSKAWPYLRPEDYVAAADFVIEINDPFTEAYLSEFNRQLKDAFSQERAFRLVREDEFCRIFKRQL